MQDNLPKGTTDRPAPLKPGQDNLSHSTEYSEVDTFPGDNEGPIFDTYEENSLKTKKKQEIMTPNFNRKFKEVDELTDNKGRLFGSEQHVEWSQPGYDVISGMEPLNSTSREEYWDNEAMNKPSEPSTIDLVADKIKETTEDVKEKIIDATDSLADATTKFVDQTKENMTVLKDKAQEGYTQMKDIAQESFAEIKDKTQESLIELKDQAQEKLEIVKEKTVDALGISKSPQSNLVDLEEKYAKLDDIKFSTDMSNEEKVEAAIAELESIPLDPSHMHNVDISDRQPLTKKVTEEFKGEDPVYKRAEAIKELINECPHPATYQPVTTIKRSPFDSLETGILGSEEKRIVTREKTFDESKIDMAMRELDSMPLDPSHIRDSETFNPALYDKDLFAKMPVSENLKIEDPEYKRAEAIKELMTDSTPHFAKQEHMSENDARQLINKATDELDQMVKDPIVAREEATDSFKTDIRYPDEERRVEVVTTITDESVIDRMKHKIDEVVSAVKERTTEMWEMTKEAMPKMDALKENATELIETAKEVTHVLEHKIEEGLSKIADQLDQDLVREMHHAPQAQPVQPTLCSDAVQTDLPLKRDDLLSDAIDTELTTPLLKDTSPENTEDMITSSLEVNKDGIQTKPGHMREKLDIITPIQLNADVGLSNFDQPTMYGEFDESQKNPVDHIPKNGGLPVNTDTKMVNNLKGLKDPHVDQEF